MHFLDVTLSPTIFNILIFEIRCNPDTHPYSVPCIQYVNHAKNAPVFSSYENEIHSFEIILYYVSTFQKLLFLTLLLWL
jgi:hypothetical protein